MRCEQQSNKENKQTKKTNKQTNKHQALKQKQHHY
jgi:hypothetical protein